RQRLEQFFMELVEKARQEQIETAGVVHGGATASFLQAGEGVGEELIEQLVSEEPAPSVREEAPVEQAPAEPRDEVLSGRAGAGDAGGGRLVGDRQPAGKGGGVRFVGG
ncbi:MAG: hypothetical protein ACYSW1_04350, partial [Planctomycetota bacterium]